MGTINKTTAEINEILTNSKYNRPFVSALTEVVAGTAITVTAPLQKIYGTGGVTITATPSIVVAIQEQIVVFLGTSDTNTVTLQDESNLAGSKLELSGAVDITLGLEDTLTLIYNTVTESWVELSRSVN